MIGPARLRDAAGTVLGAVGGLLKGPPPFFAEPVAGPIVRRDAIVVAHDPRVRAVGHRILDDGGNAFDAVVAVIAAQNVMAEGASSLAGPLGVLLHEGSTGRVTYLDAEFDDPLDPEAAWQPGMPRDGRAALVPGAPRGLEALAARHGTRPLAELLQPAIELASEGFAVTRLMASFIRWRAGILRRSEYGRATYFTSDGKPLSPGDVLRQPEVATFLTNLAAEGAPYVYSGSWGRRFLRAVHEAKGTLSEQDVARYHVRWLPPWTATYRGHRLCSSSGRGYGGAWTLLALKTLEHGSLRGRPHYSEDPEALELLVRIARAVWAEPWLLDGGALDDRDAVQSCLTSEYARRLWDDVGEAMPVASAGPAQGHSYELTVVDGLGNAAVATTTIESDPWGEGLFVEGVPISTAGSLPWSTAPGERRLSPFSMHLVFGDGGLTHAVGAISNSVVEASFQLLVNLLEYELDVVEAAVAPRFGTFPARRRLDLSKNWLDPRIDKAVVDQLKGRVKFERRGLVDTGSGAIVAASGAGILSGVPVPLPYLAEPFSERP